MALGAFAFDEFFRTHHFEQQFFANARASSFDAGSNESQQKRLL